MLTFQLYFLFIFSYIIPINSEDDITIVSDTVLDYSDLNCKSNPFLFILPHQMRDTIELTLSGKPKHRSLSFCKNANLGKTCCTSYTFSNIKTFLTDHIYTPKRNIFDTNLYYYKNVIDEHKRNFKKGFHLSDSQFNAIFDEYHEKVKEIIALAREIVNYSVQ